MKHNSLKADLHVHSKYSTRPSEWFLRRIGCAESYTDPLLLYEIAMKRGMDLVTITDHNTLSGSLEIAHLDNTFISEEITTYFPEDGCKLHVVAYGITENQHEDISRFRENMYDLVAYLNAKRIVHAVAHPLFSVNERLTIDHFEQILLLFKIFEMNGTRDDYQNRILCEILQKLTRKDIEQLANKHDLKPYGLKPWKKHLVGGSDDHSSVNIASRYTEIEGVGSVVEFLNGISQGKSRVAGRASNPRILAHTLYSIAYQFYKTKLPLDRYISKEVLLRFADRALISIHREEDGFMKRLRNFVGYRRPGVLFKSTPKTMQALLLKEARNIIFHDLQMNELLTGNTPNPLEMKEVWFRFVNNISEKILRQFADSILESVAGVNLFDIFHSIGSVGSLYTMLAPYFVAYTVFTKDRRFCQQCHAYFCKDGPTLPERTFKIAHFTDTFHEINGVATTLKTHVELAQKYNQAFTLITCGPEFEIRGVKNFLPIGTFEMPLYPDIKMFYPPLLKMLNYCYEQNFTHIHSATPGPLGLTALAIAHILKLPICGTYHTALPQYAHQLFDDPSLEELVWKYVLWYYRQMDIVYVPSHAIGDELVAKGMDKHKITFYPRGIDIKHFHPSKRNGFFQNRFTVSENDLILLYVGRVSKEKNLPVLVHAFRKLIAKRQNLRLVVVGDGPYLAEMQEAFEGLPVTFTGFLEGEDLAQAYASSDIFIFPSTTDTFGNVVLEAQASGLPVIVTDKGGPKENLIPEVTGFVVPANNPGTLAETVSMLTDNPDRLQKMKQNARKYMENRSLESAYLELWESYQAQ